LRRPVKTARLPGKWQQNESAGPAVSPSARITGTKRNQAFCPRPECRRSRRAEAQRKRRERSRETTSLTRRLKPSEAHWLRQNPMIIGLISVLIDSTDWREIEAFCASAILRGKKILDGTLVEEEGKPLRNQGSGTAVPS